MRTVAGKLLSILITLSCLLLLSHLVLNYLNVAVHNEQHGVLFELSNRFDMDDENSVPQWFTQAIFLAISLSSFLAAYLSRKRAVRRLWGVIGALALILSIDDVATMHEFLLQTVHNSLFTDQPSTFIRNAWFILLPIILLIFGWLVVRAIYLFPRRTAFLMAISGTIFIAGGVFVDSIANTVPEISFAKQGVVNGAEGFLQLLGISLFLYTVTDYLERRHGKVISATLSKLKSV